ncbi:MAG: type II and III secretion system protein family protein [Candidatus Hinthialibacter sp.]
MSFYGRGFIRFAGLLSVMILAAVQASNAFDSVNTYLDKTRKIEVPISKSYVLSLKQPAVEVSIVNPEIAKVQIINPDEILINGSTVGETSLVIWYEDMRNETINIAVKWNIKEIKEILALMLPDEAIEVVSLSDGVALSGAVQSAEAVDKAVELANSFSPKVINMLKIPGRQQVMLQVKIAEVARNFQEQLGFNFLVLDENVVGGNLLGNLVEGEIGGEGDENVEFSDAVTLFLDMRKGDFAAFLKAMKSKGLAHILAEPNLVARSGETAEFLAGGEYPIPIAQTGFNSSISIDYKEYGVRVQFTPTIVQGETIHLSVAPEVSELDFANSVQTGSVSVPALTVRRANTTVQMESGQTFAIAGLIRERRSKTNSKVPVIGDVPLLGNLFRGSGEEVSETELLIMVTPHIIKPLQSNEQTLVPKDKPTVDELYEFNWKKEQDALEATPVEEGSYQKVMESQKTSAAPSKTVESPVIKDKGEASVNNSVHGSKLWKNR